MSSRLASLVTALLLGAVAAAQGQGLPQPVAVLVPIRFESWRPSASLEQGIMPAADRFVASRDRTRHALLGGVIGAAAGVAFCTVVSSLANDSADGGLSACPLDTYFLIGGAGFALGFTIGWIM